MNFSIVNCMNVSPHYNLNNIFICNVYNQNGIRQQPSDHLNPPPRRYVSPRLKILNTNGVTLKPKGNHFVFISYSDFIYHVYVKLRSDINIHFGRIRVHRLKNIIEIIKHNSVAVVQ